MWMDVLLLYGGMEMEWLKEEMTDRAWIEIDFMNLKHNVSFLESIMNEGCKLMAVVKANAYGHGSKEIARYLNQLGVDSFAVATLDEGISLRKHGIEGEILVLGYTSPFRFRDLITYNIMQTIIDYEYGQKLNAFNQNIAVHIKIDTGMHRLGIKTTDVMQIKELLLCKSLDVKGMFTHLCVADSNDEKDISYTQSQIDNFYQLVDELKNDGIAIPKIHLQSSYGLLNYPNIPCDYARIGIALYGSLSEEGDKTKVKPDLLPVLSLRARVAMVRELEEGECMGYGLTFLAHRNSKVAVVSIGYGDGYPRNLSKGAGRVLIHGQYANIIGNICMDQLLVDVTDIPEVKEGDIVTLIGKDSNQEITAVEIASASDTLANELFSRLGSRLKRIYKESKSYV
jgi:serine/alanine racemase